MAAPMIIERPGRRPCAECDGDIGAPCGTCGGCGSILPDTSCICGRYLERRGWAFIGRERLPLFFCAEGHYVAIRFTPADEERAAA
jgi:hypothetical protein